MLYKRRVHCFGAAIVLLVLCAHHAWATEPLRRAIAAGPMYPAEPEALVASMDRLFSEADPPTVHPGRLVACIVPHDPYGLSGRVAAAAFKEITPGQFDKVLVLGACHANTLEGCSVASAMAYLTPLGPVPMAGKEVSRLCRSSLISARGLRYERNDFLQTEARVPLHETEHSIEVVLPFLQRKLGRFALLPLLVGDLNQSLSPGVDDYGQSTNENRARATVLSVSGVIRPVIDERTLIVVSTNLTHYGNDFSFRPSFHSGNAMNGIETLDMEAIQLILTKDWQGFDKYLKQTGNPICGATALKLLLDLLPAGAEGQLLDYDTSASKLQALREGDEIVRSVSYGAINFYLPASAEVTPRSGPPLTISSEALKAWEAGRAEREAAEAERPKTFTMEIADKHESDTPAADVWLSEGEDPSTAPAPTAAQATPQVKGGGRATTIRIKNGKITVQPGAKAAPTTQEESHE